MVGGNVRKWNGPHGTIVVNDDHNWRQVKTKGNEFNDYLFILKTSAAAAADDLNGML